MLNIAHLYILLTVFMLLQLHCPDYVNVYCLFITVLSGK